MIDVSMLTDCVWSQFAAFVEVLQKIVPALIKTMPARSELDKWLFHSGLSDEEIYEVLGSRSTVTEYATTSNAMPSVDDVLLKRFQEMLTKADLGAWQERASKPPMAPDTAAVMIQSRHRARTMKRDFKQQLAAATFIQRRFKKYSRHKEDSKPPARVFYGPETEPSDHYFKRVAEKRGIGAMKTDIAALSKLMAQWGSMDEQLVLRAMRRWCHNVKHAELARRRERFSQVVRDRSGGTHTHKQVRFAGMKLRHSLVLKHEQQQMVGIKLDLLDDQLDDQIRQVYELEDIQQSINQCRQGLNSSYNEVEREEFPKKQTLVQYAGEDVMDHGLKIEQRPIPLADSKDFTKIERDALKLSDTSIVDRSIAHSLQAISKGEQLFDAGEYLEAKQAFDVGHHTSKKALALTKMMGADLGGFADLDKASVAAVEQRHGLRASSPEKGQRAVSAETNKKLAELWKQAGTKVTINNIVLSEMRTLKNPNNTNDLSSRKGLIQELFNLRSTAGHLQLLSAYQFRRSAKELVDSAAQSSKDTAKILNDHAQARSSFMKEEVEEVEDKRHRKNQFGQEEGSTYDMLKATVMIHGLPNRQDLLQTEGGVLMVQRHVRELMGAFFGGVLAVTVRPRANGKSWALISFAAHQSAEALMKVTQEGLLLTWPPTANNGTILQFALVDEMRAMRSTGAFGQTWIKHKSSVRIAQVAAASFAEEGTRWTKQHDGASEKQAELARECPSCSIPTAKLPIRMYPSVCHALSDRLF